MTGPATAQRTQGSSTTERRAVLIVSAGVFMANLDLFVVNLAIPSIRTELAATGPAGCPGSSRRTPPCSPGSSSRSGAGPTGSDDGAAT
jgi:hypothetical protein